jgi:disulfide bond formation protein DsbB
VTSAAGRPRAAAATRGWLIAVALLALAAVGAALISQHRYDMQPCPWCVLQRLIFCIVAAVALLGLLWPVGAAVGIAVLAATGLGVATYQHFVAASAASCDLSLADRIMAGTGLDARWPELFMATASCADARVDLLGLPYEGWSALIFALIGTLMVWRLARHAAARRS